MELYMTSTEGERNGKEMNNIRESFAITHEWKSSASGLTKGSGS